MSTAQLLAAKGVAGAALHRLVVALGGLSFVYVPSLYDYVTPLRLWLLSLLVLFPLAYALEMTQAQDAQSIPARRARPSLRSLNTLPPELML